MVSIRSGAGAETARESVRDVTIRNNSFSSRGAGWSACLGYEGGNGGEPNPGTIGFYNNTCWGSSSQGTYGAVSLIGRESFPHQNFVVRNNLFQGLKPGDASMRLYFAPTAWSAGSNSYATGGTFLWDGDPVTFGAWKALSKGDAGSSVCRASLEDPESGDLRLKFVDSCARDRGASLSENGLDLQGDPRIEPWDRGSDEIRIDERQAIDLLGGRYRVAMQFDTGKLSGTAVPAALSDDSASFSFFDAANIEAVFKVLDGCSSNDRVWVFGAGLTNLGGGRSN